MIIQRVGITGASGFIGRELLKYPNCFPLVGDVTNPSSIEMAIKSEKPDLIVHLASISDVDYCEQPEHEKEVTEVNLRGTFYVTEAAEKHGAKVVLVSTCQVFSGEPFLVSTYKEGSQAHPKNFYGHTKLAAERLSTFFPNLKVVRSSYLFNKSRLMKYLIPLQDGHEFEFPTFITRSFIHLNHFVGLLATYLKQYDEMPRILHLAGAETISWYDFMVAVTRELGYDSSLLVRYDKENPKLGLAPRPYRCGLNIGLSRKLGFLPYSYYDGIVEMKNE